MALNENETLLWNQCSQGDEEVSKFIVQRYLQKIFGFVFYRVGCNQDLAYEVTAACFTETLRLKPSPGVHKSLLLALVRCAIKNTHETKALIAQENLELPGVSPERKATLQLVGQALLALSEASKLTLLLRDQMGLRYSEMAYALEASEHQVKEQVVQARLQLREKVEKLLDL